MISRHSLAIAVALCLSAAWSVFPCSTALVLNSDETVTGRTMDFGVDMQTVINIVPKGTTYRFGTTKLNFVSFDAFGHVIGHGINEKGLSVASLWLNPTEYPTNAPSGKKLVGVLEFSPFVLGTMTTVREVLAFFDSGDIDFNDLPPEIKKLDLLHQHLYFVDSRGETLLLEWLGGKRHAYLNETPVIVNDPPFEEQRKIWDAQLASKEDIINYEYNLISKRMHDPDSRYEMLRRLTEQSLPTKGPANIDKAFQIMKRVSYMPIKPYLGGDVSWTLYTVVMVHTKDAVRVFYTDDENEAIRMIDFGALEWKNKRLPMKAGPKYLDMTPVFNATN